MKTIPCQPWPTRQRLSKENCVLMYLKVELLALGGPSFQYRNLQRPRLSELGIT